MITENATYEQQVRFEAQPTSAGNPSTIDGALRVTIDTDETGGAQLVQDPAFPLVFVIVPPNVPGKVSGSIDADTDLTSGERLLQDRFEITFGTPQADAFNWGATRVEAKGTPIGPVVPPVA